MNVRMLFYLLATAALLDAGSPPATSAQSWSAARNQIYQALLSNKALNPDRTILHLSHTCSLKLDGTLYPVIELEEGVPKPMTMGGVNTIFVLSPKLRVVHRIDFSTERPLYCAGNQLVVFGDLTVDGVTGAGNVLTFSEHGQRIEIKHLDVTELPMETTAKRKSPPQ